MRAERIRRSTRMNDFREHGGLTRNDEATEQLARDLYEQVRQLNYATGGPPGLTRPSTAYTVLGNLSAAAHGIDQTLTQLDRFLRHELNAGHLGHDQGHNPAQAIQDACGDLSNARAETFRFARSLSNAQNALNAIHGPIQPTISAPHPGALAADDFPMSVGETLQTGPTDDGAGPQPPPPDKATRDVRKGV
jgi:hypothetical protein